MIDGNKEIERDLRARGFDAAADRFAELTATGLAALSPVQGERGNSSYQCVSAWQDEWLEESGPHWGDSIAWATAYDIARRLDRLAALSTLKQSPAGDGEASFQARVAPWMQACFGPKISADKLERGDRFLEEDLELLQSGGYPKERVAALVEYVWSRPVGEPKQEVGGVMVTLAAYCLAFGLDMHEAGEVELARINVPAIVEKIRVKQATKAAAIGNSSPLPIAPTPTTEAPDGGVRARIAFDHAVMVAADEMAKMTGHRFATSRIRKLVTDIAETLGSPATEIARTALAGSAGK